MWPGRAGHYACTKVPTVRTQIYTALPLKLGPFRKGAPCKFALRHEPSPDTVFMLTTLETRHERQFGEEGGGSKQTKKLSL